MIVSKLIHSLIKHAPTSPGIYIWKDVSGRVLYIGKAINLRKRLLYYIKDEKDLISKTAAFLKLADSVEWIEVRSELEAILLEMNLIRTLKPKYNSLSKDDKRPLFVHITDDDLPRVKTARQEIAGNGDYIGPFPDSGKLKQILKKVRYIFPYCSCSLNRKKPCLYVDLGLCNPSAVKIEQAASRGEDVTEQRKKYQRNITRLKMFLNGKIDHVVRILEKEMKELSEELKYEEAAEVKRQIEAIETILTEKHNIGEYLSDRSLAGHLQKSQVKALAVFLGLPAILRIEGYDIANTQGTNPTSAMVVFEGGRPNTSEYRKFKITEIEGPNDPAMIQHTLERRFYHDDWDQPDLILIDGGKTQVNAALRALHKHNLAIPIVGLMKRNEDLVIPRLVNGKTVLKVVSPPLDEPYLTILRAVRDEAHRFGTTYHKKLRAEQMVK